MLSSGAEEGRVCHIDNVIYLARLSNAGLVVGFGIFSVEYRGHWHFRQCRLSYVCPGILGEII
jgi:hypothetical protein